MRQWALRFGQAFANRIRRRLSCAGDKWHLDEVAIRIADVQRWLWRAVDQTGRVLDGLVQSWREKRAVKKELMGGVEHRRHQGLNNWAENSHQLTRQRERQRKRFKSPWQAPRFLSANHQISTLFRFRRDCVIAIQYRAAKARAFEVWADTSGIAAAA